MQIKEERLKEFILDSGLVDKKELAQAGKSKKPLTEYLLSNKLISANQLAKVYAYLWGVPFVNLMGQTIEPEVLKVIPEAIARAHNIIAFKQSDQTLEVAMLDPADLETIETITKKSGLKVEPRLTSEESIKEALRQYQKTLQLELEELTADQTERLKVVQEKDEPASEQELAKIAKKLPIIKIVDTLIKHAILQNASDIHIEPLEKEIAVRYRVDGLLRPAMTLPKQILTGVIARIKVLSNLKLDEHRLPQDGRFKIQTPDYKISFRVSVLPTLDGEKVAMRLLPEDAKGLTLEKLGLTGESLEKIHLAIKRPHGMILVTGPTGAGKTTTLYTILDILNQPEVNITTIEDPIEYRLKGINQAQVKPKIGFTFANGLRTIVRQDPDIVMVGEIRDNETADIAVNAALTGHLLLSTLHTNDAATSLPRLIDMDIEPFLIASTVNLIIAQRLVRKICQHSPSKLKKYKLIDKEIKRLEKEFDLAEILKILKQEKIIKPSQDWSDIDFVKTEKCPKCQDGYLGRVGIYEVLEIDDEIRSLITRQATSDEINQAAQSKGMISLSQDGFIKAVQGVTTLDEVLRVSQE